MTAATRQPAPRQHRRVDCPCGSRWRWNEYCSAHSVRIPRGNYGNIISTKDDYNEASPDLLDAPCIAVPAIVEHWVGEPVKVGGHYSNHRINGPTGDHYGFPHAHATGIIKAKVSDTLWIVAFPDGTSAGFYHNEIGRIAPTVEPPQTSEWRDNP